MQAMDGSNSEQIFFRKSEIFYSDVVTIDFENQPKKPSISLLVAKENTFCGQESSFLFRSQLILISFRITFLTLFSHHWLNLKSNEIHSLFKKFLTCPITQIHWLQENRLLLRPTSGAKFERKFIITIFVRKLFRNSTHVWPALDNVVCTVTRRLETLHCLHHFKSKLGLSQQKLNFSCKGCISWLLCRVLHASRKSQMAGYRTPKSCHIALNFTEKYSSAV